MAPTAYTANTPSGLPASWHRLLAGGSSFPVSMASGRASGRCTRRLRGSPRVRPLHSAIPVEPPAMSGLSSWRSGTRSPPEWAGAVGVSPDAKAVAVRWLFDIERDVAGSHFVLLCARHPHRSPHWSRCSSPWLWGAVDPDPGRWVCALGQASAPPAASADAAGGAVTCRVTASASAVQSVAMTLCTPGVAWSSVRKVSSRAVR